ncbi:P-loop containing nucleoside triphosphate hydrolase protein [Biscogniauxia sp. FL1348]|nr:P-loop containing nucleoside triphosphate hydrolase protein [Biscogniauxia sp. FL1348]
MSSTPECVLPDGNYEIGRPSEMQTETNSIEERIKRIETEFQDKLSQLEKSFQHLLSQQPRTDIELPEANERPQNQTPPKEKLKDDEEHADKAGSDEEQSPPRAKVVIQKWSDEASAMKDHDFDIKQVREVKSTDENELPKEKPKQAYILRKVIPKDDDEEEYGELEIIGPELANILQKTITSYTLHPASEGIIKLYSPYRQIIHHWEDLQREALLEEGSEEERVGRSDLNLLLCQLQQWSGDVKLDEYFRIQGDLVPMNNITFETLWTIFPPGTLVYSKPFMKQDQLFVVLDNWCTWPGPNTFRRRNDPQVWNLECFTYDWDGNNFHRYSITIPIEEFEDTKPIATLPVYPWEYVSKKDEIEKKLFSRGQKFREICTASANGHMFKYEGQAMVEKKGFGFVTDKDDDESSMGSYIRRERRGERHDAILRMSGYNVSDGQVMVDFASYYKYGVAETRLGELKMDDDDMAPHCSTCEDNENMEEVLRARYDFVEGSPDENWDKEQVMLCPPRVLGYILRDKLWAQLKVDGIEKIQEHGADDAFNSKLVLPENDSGSDPKSVLLGLVKSHSAPAGEEVYQLRDIVPGKGQGLIILLYGPPGVGKTSTAETIAIATRKPLFSIGVADVGTSAKYVESNLEKIFDLAQTWKAILLIDEADVFLQSRGSGQFGPTTERNALVSVFLRVLEYYRGIMILTTNQIAQFDVAVQSRINVAFKYDPLNAKQTTEIFRKFLEQYRENKMVDKDELKQINQWCERKLPKQEFDGRQIRNIITSAVGLAASKGEKLKVSHLEDLVEIVSDFKSELKVQMDRYMQAQTMK